MTRSFTSLCLGSGIPARTTNLEKFVGMPQERRVEYIDAKTALDLNGLLLLQCEPEAHIKKRCFRKHYRSLIIIYFSVIGEMIYNAFG